MRRTQSTERVSRRLTGYEKLTVMDEDGNPSTDTVTVTAVSVDILVCFSTAYNLTAILRHIELPEEMKKWSLSTIQLNLIKVGARVVRHARAIIFQLAEVAVTDQMINSILKAIDRLRSPPKCV